jgi:hypothetical protein
MTIATIPDVAASLLRTLTENETHYAPSLLARAEAILIAHVPDLLERATEIGYRASVVTVEADMIARVLRNPDGLLSETEGAYTYRLDRAVASGRLGPTPEELRALGGKPQLTPVAPAIDAYARARYSRGSDGHRFLTGG